MKIVNPVTGGVICGASTQSEAMRFAQQHANDLGAAVEIHPEASSTLTSDEDEITVVEPDFGDDAEVSNVDP